MAIAGVEIADLVLEVCHAPGAGALALGGAVAGYRRFADAVSEGAHFPYSIVGVTHDDEWETGTGTLDGEGRLVRAPAASSAGGAAVNFSGGEKHVALTPDAGWLNAVNDHGHGVAAIEGLAEALAVKQAASEELSAIAALETAAFGRGALCQADAAAYRSYIGAGTVTSVAGSGGTTGLTFTGGPVSASGTLTLGGALAMAHGGTGASDAAGARAALGLGSIATAAATSYLPVTGGTMSGSMAFHQVPAPFSASFDGNIGFAMSSYGTGVVAAATFHRARGTEASPASVVSGDTLGGFRWRSQHATGSTGTVGEFRVDVIEPAPSATAMGLRFAVYLPPVGAVARTPILTADHSEGLVIYQQARPATDNSRSLGTAAHRWSVVYAGTGTINTSDAAAKREIGAVPDAVLDGWGDVAWRHFRFAEAFADKGDAARWHVGLVAQEVRDAIDGAMGEGAARRLGLLCFDAWDDEDAVVDQEGQEVRPARAAGSRWGLRYDECLALEAAWQRRRMDRLEARIAAMEASDAAG